jgi:hypothetical protein
MMTCRFNRSSPNPESEALSALLVWHIAPTTLAKIELHEAAEKLRRH